MTKINSFECIKNMDHNFVIRPIKKRDLHQAYQMLFELAEHDELLNKFKLKQKHLGDYLFGNKSSWYGLVVENTQDNSLKGMLLYTVSLINRAFHLKPQVYIDHLYIKQETRRIGLGQRLIRELIKRLSNLNINRIEVWSMKSNQEANIFYKSLGFKEIQVKNYQLIIQKDGRAADNP